jgi:hypothetical protein
MTHEEAMKKRWFQCWYYPVGPRNWYYPAGPCKFLSERHRLEALENKKLWYKKWGKDILKEAKQYIQAYEKLSKKDREVLGVNEFTYDEAIDIIKESKGKRNGT